ncbi:MAG TPA: hypothetical protein VLQ91_01380, partial [Draconibacterium sp.]|nr:hypothetical protein [Draconibacterium sp.]
MIFNRFFWFIFTIVLLISEISRAQISQGGTPMKTIALKSSRIKVVEMPPFSNFSITEKEDETNESAIKLKPFRFAHP